MIFFSFILQSFSKKLANNESIYVFGAKANPILNPLETYNFDLIPFCLSPETFKSSKLDKITGSNKKFTPISINYLSPVPNKSLCTIEVSKTVKDTFHYLIQRDFIYQLYVGKLPVWARVGQFSQDNKIQIYTHFHFTLSFRDAHVVIVDLSPENLQPIDNLDKLTFSFSTEWVSTNLKYKQRFQKYCDLEFAFSKVRYYALFNTLLMTVIFILLVCYVLFRYVGNDFSRYEREREILDYETDFSLDKGWKVLHNDVFRVPKHPAFLSSLIGTGAQILVACCTFILANFVLRLHFKRNSTIVVGFCVYSLSAFVSGYFSAAMYKRWQGKNWIMQLILTSSIIPSIYLLYKLIVWFFSILYGATGSIHSTSVVVGFFVWIIVVIPLSVFGGIIGRHWFFIGELPVKTGIIKRVIPKTPLYLTTPILGFFIGLCGSISISMEIYYILCSIWKYKLYFAWYFLLSNVIMCCIITASATVVAIYFRLSAENYHWQWPSLIAPACSGIFIFIECMYFACSRLTIDGPLHVVYIITSSCCISLIVSIACGFVGFVSSAFFIRVIFKNLKID